MADSPARLQLTLLPDPLAVCRLDARAEVPTWAFATPGGLVSITRTGDEISVVCPLDRVPVGARCERPWRCLAVAGPLDFALVGILASLAVPLAGAGVSIFALSTFDTDYLLVYESDLGRAIIALEAAGHRVVAAAETRESPG